MRYAGYFLGPLLWFFSSSHRCSSCFTFFHLSISVRPSLYLRISYHRVSSRNLILITNHPMNVIRHLSAVTPHILVSCSYSTYGFLLSFAIIIEISNIAPACLSWWRSILIHSWCAWRPTSSLLPGSRFCPATAGPLSICYPSPCWMRSHSFSFTTAFLWVLNKGCQIVCCRNFLKSSVLTHMPQHNRRERMHMPSPMYMAGLSHAPSGHKQHTHINKHTHIYGPGWIRFIPH